MSEVIDISQSSPSKQNPLIWGIVLGLAGLAWIPTLRQTLDMLPMPMYGTMGMTFAPFLIFWTMMMAAMMLPALAPTVSLRMAAMQKQTAHFLPPLICIGAFIVGYLFVWGIFGIPIFVFCVGIDHLMRTTPLLALGLGITLFVSAGLYQFTPQKRAALLHCNPTMSDQVLCQIATPNTSIRVQLQAGLQHGGTCLQCWGILMLILLGVGLMNPIWMGLMTLIIFLEKTWVHGYKLSIVLGFVLIFYGMLAFVSPALLPGLFLPWRQSIVLFALVNG